MDGKAELFQSQVSNKIEAHPMLFFTHIQSLVEITFLDLGEEKIQAPIYSPCI